MYFHFLFQMTSFLILFLVGGQIETQLLSTGAFEVYLNGKSHDMLHSYGKSHLTCYTAMVKAT